MSMIAAVTAIDRGRDDGPGESGSVQPSSEIYLHKISGFRFSQGAQAAAATALALTPGRFFTLLLDDKESEGTRLAAKTVLDAVLAGTMEPLSEATRPVEAAALPELDGLRDELALARRQAAAAVQKAGAAAKDVRAALLKERAPIALIAGCWLDNASQPATQPARVVNLLFAQHFADRGAGVWEQSTEQSYRHALGAQDMTLPPIAASAFVDSVQAADDTWLLASFYLALARYPANYLPEIIGLNWAFRAIGIDAHTAGWRFSGDAAAAAAFETAQCWVQGLRSLDPMMQATLFARFVRGARWCAALESWHLDLVCRKLETERKTSLDEQVARIIARHRAYPGKQHIAVMIDGRSLTEIFDDPAFDLPSFMATLKSSRYFAQRRGGECRFMSALKFGGPMFAIFSDAEAAILQEWANTESADTPPAIAAAPARRAVLPPGTTATEIYVEDLSEPLDERQLFHMLINIENYACVLPVARRLVLRRLDTARRLSHQKHQTKYTDPCFFEYSPESFEERMASVYWQKLVTPFEPLETIPSRDEVIFNQKNMALGSLIDGAWVHRIGATGRTEREADRILFEIYADEMGRGDVRKNHLTVIHEVLASMDVSLPPVGDPAFIEEDELIDQIYPNANFQLCLSQLPDSFFAEALGYNVAIEMFGSGELRMHEIQKLRFWNFSTAYEVTHLAIDNFSAGHTRMGMNAIVGYLDEARRNFGDDVMKQEWRRVWAGYASFAQFVEKVKLEEAVPSCVI